MKLKDYPLSRSEKLIMQELPDEILIYDLKNNKAYCLNKTAALVWHECNGKKSIAEISQSLSKKLKSPVTEDLVWLTIEQLKKNELLDNTIKIATRFDGLSRREIVRKIGFTSMITLPVISSIVAPAAIHAQSLGACRTDGQSCTRINGTSQGSCCSGLSCLIGSDDCASCPPRVGLNSGGPFLAPNFTETSVTTPGFCDVFKARCCSNSIREVPNGGQIDCVCN